MEGGILVQRGGGVTKTNNDKQEKGRGYNIDKFDRTTREITSPDAMIFARKIGIIFWTSNCDS